MNGRRTILVVDDDPGLREALVEQLALEDDLDTVTADNASRALEMAREGAKRAGCCASRVFARRSSC